MLDDLRRVAGGLHFVDGVVAENGAVIHFPDSGYTSRRAPALPPHFLDELGRRGIPHRAGDCLVDADANDAPRLLEVVRALEMPARYDLTNESDRVGGAAGASVTIAASA
jgi:hypothetical protein